MSSPQCARLLSLLLSLFSNKLSCDVATPSEILPLHHAGDRHALRLNPGCCEPPHLSYALCRRYLETTITLRKHAYSNILKISPPKTEKFSEKISDIFHISALNIDCGYPLEPPRRGGSNGYPQSMFLSRNKRIMYTPVNPSFTI